MEDGLLNERVGAFGRHAIKVGVYENSVTEGSL